MPDLPRSERLTQNRVVQLFTGAGGLGYRRPAGQSGARFTWSSKVQGKTVSLALSEDQADWLDKAISEHRKLKKLLSEMRRTSRKIMRLRFPDTERRTAFNKKVLRLI